MQIYSNIKKYKEQMGKFIKWSESYKIQDADGYMAGQKHGIIIETKYTSVNDPKIMTLKKICKENCQSTWSVGFFPPQYQSITFRFFDENDIKLFNSALKQLET
tara:strand:+ start:133 stop:444 length:312 start_codon:yes stop_codon:yes gene_type:complete